MSAAFPRRGEVYFANLEPVFGSEQGGIRPVLIIQNDVSNQFSPVVIVAVLTSAPAKRAYINEVVITPGLAGAPRSRILLNQLRTVDKRRLGGYVGRLNANDLEQVDEALKLSLGLVTI